MKDDASEALGLGNFMDIQRALRAREQLDVYRDLEYAKYGGENNAQYQEIVKRLRQLTWIVVQVVNLCDQRLAQSLKMNQMLPVTALADRGYQQLVGEITDTTDQIELYTESFYWIAWRAMAVIRLMPGLNSFESVGVRTVRNLLLEHVEGRGGSTSVGIGWGAGVGHDGKLVGGDGPTIATLTAGMDKGLYVNATEFFEEVARVTQRCILSPELIRKKSN